MGERGASGFSFRQIKYTLSLGRDWLLPSRSRATGGLNRYPYENRVLGDIRRRDLDDEVGSNGKKLQILEKILIQVKFRAPRGSRRLPKKREKQQASPMAGENLPGGMRDFLKRGGPTPPLFRFMREYAKHL